MSKFSAQVRTYRMVDSILMALGGGALLGLSGAMLFASHGRIAGISGILGQLLIPSTPDRDWRFSYIIGMLAGGLAVALLAPNWIVVTDGRTLVHFLAGGFLVGIGSRMMNGCTSGHGICGISRMSKRSFTAVSLFMLTGGLAVYLFGSLGMFAS